MLNNISITIPLFKNITYAVIGIITFVGGLAITAVSISAILYAIGYIVVLISTFFNLDPNLWALYNPNNSFFKITPTTSPLYYPSHQNIGSGFIFSLLFFTSIMTLFFFGMKDLGLKILTKFSNK